MNKIREFNDNIIIDESIIIFNANSFNKHSEEHLSHLDELFKYNNNIKIGDKILELKEFKKGDKLSIYNDTYTKAKVTFDDNVFIPVLSECGSVWMSHTPMEVITCQKGIDIANGHVLMGGLGIGYQANRILAKSNVTKLTIYELDIELINVIGKSLIDMFGDRVEFVNESIYNAEDIYDTYVIDIYPSYTDFLYDDVIVKTFPDFHKNKDKYWAWGDLTFDGLVNHAIENLVSNDTEQDFYEELLYIKRYIDLYEFWVKVEEQIFLCNECGYWYDLYNLENDEDMICTECCEF